MFTLSSAEGEAAPDKAELVCFDGERNQDERFGPNNGLSICDEEMKRRLADLEPVCVPADETCAFICFVSVAGSTSAATAME